jgi:2'-5' RNA ligase
MKRLSVWIIPQDEDYSKFEKVINELKDSFNGADLFSHISLPFSFEYNFEQIDGCLNNICKSKKSFFIELDKIETSRKKHQQVFYLFKNSNKLSELASLIKNELGEIIIKERDAPFHLSLIYADNKKDQNYSYKEKESMISLVNSKNLPNKILIKKLAVVDLCSDNPSDWKIKKEYFLK